VNATQTSQLFTDLSVEESAVVQGGRRCRRYHRSSYYPTYYSYRPTPSYSYYYPSYSYGYGYGGYGSVNQSVNVSVRYDD
jgi:hypothetical protein